MGDAAAGPYQETVRITPSTDAKNTRANLASAKPEFEKVLTLLPSAEFPRERARAAGYLGDVQKEQREFAAAIKSYRSSLNTRRQLLKDSRETNDEHRTLHLWRECGLEQIGERAAIEVRKCNHATVLIFLCCAML